MTNRRNGTLYVGVTDDLARRTWEHRAGLVEGFTKQYGLTRLVFAEHHDDMRKICYLGAMQAPEGPPPAPSSRAQDVAVIAFCELWGLVFGLPAGEDLYHGAPVTARMITFLSIGSAFAIFGAAWPWLRNKFPLAALVRISTDFRYCLFALAMLSVWLQISSIRTDLETYLMPRVVTDAQAEDLRAYLAAREPHAATVKLTL